MHLPWHRLGAPFSAGRTWWPHCPPRTRPARWPPGGFQETENQEIRFPEISTPVLEKVCQYFYYKIRYQNT